MDAITLLKNDHKTVEKLFKSFEKAGDGAKVRRRDIVVKILEELAVHASIDEQVFYPAIRELVPDSEDMVLESLEEHHIVKWTLSELESLPPDNERFVAKVTVLMESVRHHVEEEEGDLFPEVRAALGRKQLAQIGEAMEQAKKTAPTRPHPKAPDTPPGNLIAGPASAALDVAVNAGKKAMRSATKQTRKSTTTGRKSTAKR